MHLVRSLIFSFGFLVYSIVIIEVPSIVAVKNSLALKDIAFIVLSQPNTYLAQQAATFKIHFEKQVKALNQTKQRFPDLLFLHEHWSETGSWTIFPLLKDLSELYGAKSAKWIFFCEEGTRLNLKKFLNVLSKFDPTKHLFLGHALRDEQATIIHHFAFHENPSIFKYPDFAAGFLLSNPLLQSLAKRWVDSEKKIDFSVDAKHEFALFVWNDGKGTSLTNVPELCITANNSCATYYPVKLPECGTPVSKSDIVFAVKTCEKFHESRVPVVKETWAKHTGFIEFFSEKKDSSIPTVSLGINNTEKGHCAKTLGILSKISAENYIERFKWLVIADDDTLLSVKRLRKLLSCFDYREAIALGERYGYGVVDSHGYDYITGGGGIVLSLLTVTQLIDSGLCFCPANDSPDDMTLGMCLKRLGIPIIHSPLFHQARPEDYAKAYLSHQEPISFHKHYMVNPREIYQQWFAKEDDSVHSHTEL